MPVETGPKMHQGKVALVFLTILILGISMGITGKANAGGDNNAFTQAGFVTPTPGPDGRIIYYAQPEDDSFWTIAAKAGITLEELYALNGIQDGDYLITGMELTLGFAGPPEPTHLPEDFASPTPIEPTPTPLFNTGEICVLLFLDENGNARLEEGEGVIPGGQISVIDANGTLTDEATSGENAEGDCFQGLQAGDYNVSAAVPPEYNPTTTLNLPIRLQAGDIKYVQFGAQPSAALQDQSGDDLGDRSRWFGVFGVLMLLGAAGLAIYASRYGKRISKLP
jgi:hypothetical protein